MKRLLIIATIGIAALGASSAMAAPAGIAAGNTLDVQEVRDSYVHKHNAAREAFKMVQGTYAMDDGTTLWLYQRAGRFVAELSGQSPVEVIASRAGSFVAVNGVAELKFRQNAGGQVAEVVLTKSS